jgi:signal transduction histidine kinase
LAQNSLDTGSSDDDLPRFGRFLYPLVDLVAKIPASVQIKLLLGFLGGTLLLVSVAVLAVVLTSRPSGLLTAGTRQDRGRQMELEVSLQTRYRAVELITGGTTNSDNIAQVKRSLADDVAALESSLNEAGKMELYLESFDVEPVVRDVAAVIRPLAQKNSNELRVTCPADVGVMHADLTKVRQILFNLLSNACKFTDHGVVSLETERRAMGGAPWLLFRISDSGIGMTPEQMGKLFQPFTQADAATMRRYGGTGLGLALCQRFAKMMGGQMSVASEFGRGSQFTVLLPVEVPELTGGVTELHEVVHTRGG